MGVKYDFFLDAMRVKDSAHEAGSGSPYILPTAAADTLGGIMTGTYFRTGASGVLMPGTDSCIMQGDTMQCPDGFSVTLGLQDCVNTVHRYSMAGTLTLSAGEVTQEITSLQAGTGYAACIFDIPESGSVVASAGMTLGDALEAGKSNRCIVQLDFTSNPGRLKGTLYVTDTEDLATQSN